MTSQGFLRMTSARPLRHFYGYVRLSAGTCWSFLKLGTECSRWIYQIFFPFERSLLVSRLGPYDCIKPVVTSGFAIYRHETTMSFLLGLLLLLRRQPVARHFSSLGLLFGITNLRALLPVLVLLYRRSLVQNNDSSRISFIWSLVNGGGFGGG